MAALNEEKPRSSQIVPEQEGKLCIGKQAANILVRIPRAEKYQSGKNGVLALITGKNQCPSGCHQETRRCINNTEVQEGPRPPKNITDKLLLHLGSRSKRKLLQLFNDGWENRNSAASLERSHRDSHIEERQGQFEG